MLLSYKSRYQPLIRIFAVTKSHLTGLLTAAFFVISFSAASAVPISSYSPAYDLERTKETLRSKATDVKIRKFSDQYRQEKLKTLPEDQKDTASQSEVLPRKIMKLKRLIFDRSSLLSDTFLEKIAAEYEGKQISLADINDIVNRVDRAYKMRGYYAAKAYIPNQDIRDNILKVNLIEGTVGKVRIKENQSTRESFVAGGNIYLDSQKSAAFEHLGSGADTKIRSAENITLNDVRADGDFLLEAAQNAWLRDVDVASALTVESGGKLTADNLDAGKTITLTAAEADLDQVRADGDIKVTVNGRNLIGALTSADGDIALDVTKADANLRGTLKAGNGEVRVSAANSILNAGAGAEGAIVANTVDLTAQKGSIGTADNYLTVDSSYHRAGWIKALAQKGIYIDEVNGPMNIRQFVSGGNIDMRVNSSIVGIANADPALPHFKADNITLHSKGQIGGSDNPLVLALNNNRRGKINLQAGQGIVVRKLGEGLVSDYIYNDGRGKIWIELPSGHAHIADVRAADGFKLTIREGMPFYNIWLTNLDLEARMINPPYTEYPEENPIQVMSRPLDARYRLQLDRGLFLNIGNVADEEKLSLF